MSLITRFMVILQKMEKEKKKKRTTTLNNFFSASWPKGFAQGDNSVGALLCVTCNFPFQKFLYFPS